MPLVIMTIRSVDALVVFGGVLFSLRVSGGLDGSAPLLVAAMASGMSLLGMEAVGLYRRWRGAQLSREFNTIFAGWALTLGGLMLAMVLFRPSISLPMSTHALVLVLPPVGVCITHALSRLAARLARTLGFNKRRAVIVGAGKIGRSLALKLHLLDWAGIEVAAFFDDDADLERKCFDNIPVVGPVSHAPQWVREHGIDLVYMALPMRAEDKMRELMDAFGAFPVSIYLVPDFFIHDLLGAKLVDLDGTAVVSMSESPQIGPAGAIKRVEDLVLALGILVLFSPLFLLVGLMIKFTSPGPVIFGHGRIGHLGKKFKCYKFRTMVPNSKEILEELLERDPEARREWEENYKLKNDPRITRIGRLLRKTSLDELPQLLNVLRGEMSLVGPRPIIEDEIPKYGKNFRFLAQVRPGMTGLWQVSGRNDVTYQERINLDVKYAKNWSVSADIFILFKTVKVVLAGHGSY